MIVHKMTCEGAWRAVAVRFVDEGAELRIEIVHAWGLDEPLPALPTDLSKVTPFSGLGSLLFGGSGPMVLPLDASGKPIEGVRWLVSPADERSSEEVLAFVKQGFDRAAEKMAAQMPSPEGEKR